MNQLNIYNDDYDAMVVIGGRKYYFMAAVYLMDDEIREELHAKMAPCHAQEFTNAYLHAHYKKYGKAFVIN